MEQHQNQPRLCQEAEMMKVVRPGPADSPPPNCAICLGICTNKCFTDCCLHQFCFSCLLEWSKIKAECPLCKKPFKSIIYNIKSNLEYEEHIITNPERQLQVEDLPLEDDIDVHTEYLFLPNGPRPQRHFQYRTTFTLEPGGEFAIQQLLLSHPRTNSLFLNSERFLNHRISHHSIQQRRNIYSEGLWVEPQPDVTGRFRESSPHFFRENQAQIHRIVPWLNRELTALLIDYVDIYQIQERIMEMLYLYSIQSAQFRDRIVSYLGSRTDHFIHEFFNYVRSPYDMIGYDRHVTYNSQPPVMYSHSVSDDDSDVRVVDSPANDDCIFIPPRTPEVIVINSDSSSDSDVVIRYPSPPVTPPVVNLIDSDTDDTISVSHAADNRQATVENNERTEAAIRSPQLPIKIRYKRNRNSAEIVNKKHKDKKNAKMKIYDSSSESDTESYRPKSDSEYSTAYISTSSSSSSSSSDTNSSSSSSASNTKYVKSLILKRIKSKSRKRKNSYKTYKTSKYRSKKSLTSSRDGTPERSYKIKKRKSSKQKKSKRKNNDSSYNNHRSKKLKKIKMERSDSSQSEKDSKVSSSSDDEDFRRRKKPTQNNHIKTERIFHNSDENETKQEPDSEPSESETPKTNEHSDCDQPEDIDVAGPSLRSVIVRGNSKWYSRPEFEDTTTDNNSD